jgi:hypothetical protein
MRTRVFLFAILAALILLCGNGYPQSSQPSNAQIAMPPPAGASALQLEQPADPQRLLTSPSLLAGGHSSESEKFSPV